MPELRYFLTPLEVEPDGNRHVPFWRTRVQRDRPAAASIGIQPFGARDFAIASVYAETADLNAFAAAGAIELPRSGRITLAKLNAIRTMLGLAYVPPVLSANTDGLQVIRALGVVAQLCQRIRGRFGSRMEDADRTRFNELGGIWAPLKDIADARDRLDAAVALWEDRPIYTGGIDLGFGLPLAGGAIPATQSFTAANGTTLPTVDSRWVDTGGGTWDVLSNQAEVPDDSTETGVAFNDPDTIANHIGIVDIVASGNYTGGAGARHATGANTYYTFYGEVGGNCFLYDISGTSGTELFAGSSCALNDELGCSAVGSTIKGWKNGLEITSVTDSTWTTGFTGMAGWANISPRLDNFEAYNIPITVLATSTGTASGQTHNPGTGVTPKAVVAFMFGSTDSTDRVSSISYGGVAMTRVPTNGFAQDTAGEPCAIVCYTLLSSIPTGSQSVTYSATGTQRLTVVSFDSVWSALEIKASGKQEGDAANPSITLDSSTDQATRILGVMSGGASLTPNGYGIELSDQTLSGAFACWVGHHIMAKTGSVAISATATSDDVAAIAIALGESAGGPVEVGLAGAQPASTGTIAAQQDLARSLAGAQPAASGDITTLQYKALAGTQPAATGDITAKQYKALAGAQPAPSGTLAVAYRKALAGAQPAASGALAVQYRIALAGAQPAPTGTIAAQQDLARSLAGAQPAPTGTISTESSTAVDLAGAQPSATGTIAAQQDLARSLAGAQPAASGALSARRTLTHIALAGAQPAASGDITTLQYKALTGAQPAPSGTIDAEVGTILVNLAGAQPASTGTLAAFSTLARTLSGDQPAPSGALALRYILVHIALVGIQPASTGTLAPFSTLARSLAGAQPAGSGTIAAVIGDSHGWVEVTLTITPALELGVAMLPAIEITPEFNG